MANHIKVYSAISGTPATATSSLNTLLAAAITAADPQPVKTEGFTFRNSQVYNGAGVVNAYLATASVSYQG
jgi:hypothetical protein